MGNDLLSRAINACVRCVRCGALGVFTCDCHERCSCGWFADKGQPCGNPNTARCSTKVKYGVYNRRTKRYEPKEPADGR